jgi:pimeloyl-ACP methyl ester carboxylesterase
MSDANTITVRLAASAQRFEIDHDGCRIVWRMWGNGPPLVLLHGGSGSWTHWIRNIEALAKDRQLLVPDLPGHGESDLPETCDNATFQSLLATGIRELAGARLPVDIVGFSLGGVIGTHLAAWSPDLVRRLILVDTGGLGPPMGNIAPARAPEHDNPDKPAASRHPLLNYMLHSPDSVDDAVLGLLRSNAKQCRIDTGGINRLILPNRVAAILPQVACQLDAIWGEHERLLPDPAAQLAALRGFKPDSEMRVIPQASHWVMYEAAAAFNEALADLLNAGLRAG